MKKKLMTMILAAVAMLGAWATDTHGKVQLWENGPYWAETNIGAENPWDSGYYFWWGDTIGYKWENNAWVASDGSSSGFSFSGGNAPTYGTDAATLQSEGWITEDGVLAPDHDAAQSQWGGGWRMPTVQDLNDLCYNKCVWIWTTTNGVNGYLVRGKDEYSSASIFLPCTGYGSGYSRTAFSSHGYYWSSVPASSWNNAGGIVYLSDRNNIEYTSVRYAGSPIRPVQDAPAAPDDPETSASDLYCVIDLSGGPEAESYPVSYLSKAPDGGWTGEYKTTKLVLRKIRPEDWNGGTFIMGPNEYEYHRWQSQWENGSFFRCYESDPREVTITEPFYIGVFEVTQKQYELVTGATPSDYTGDMRPVNKVSWNDVRGNSSTYDWPSSTEVSPSSFMGKIRAKTGIDTFDLPTEAKWEYACRAGTTTSFNDGHNLASFSVDAGLNLLGHYQFTASGGLSARGASVVGSFVPNAWGLYDMHGNVNEWVLDWSSYGNPDTAVVDPVGPSSGSRRNSRGGGWNTAAHNCRSGFSIEVDQSARDYAVGFRLSLSTFASATFDENFDGGRVAARGVFTNSTVLASAPNDAVRRGWMLVGWSTTPDGECVEETELVADGETYYAQWTEAAPATVTFDMNYKGGGTIVADLYVTDKVLEWSPEDPERQGWTFAGWFTEPEGGEKISESDLAEDGATYYAHWSDVAFTTGGDADWYIDSSEGSAWRSGAISHSQSTWLEATFSGFGSVKFDVKTSTESGWDWLEIYADGEQLYQYQYSGETDWTEVELLFDNAGVHTIMWKYRKDGSGSSGSDCVWMRNFTANFASVAMTSFAENDVYVSEAETMSIVVNGGSESRPTSVMLCLSYLTAAAADLDLAKGEIDGEMPKGGLKFPLTLAWDTGDTEPKTIAIPVKPDKAVEDNETLLFQLADAVGMEISGYPLCGVTISDANAKTLKAAVSPYKPKKGESVATNIVTVSGSEGGFVAGTGSYTAGTKITLTAEARPGWTFTGWSDCCSEGILSDKAKYQVVVNGDAEYYATFEPQPYIFAVAFPGDGGKVSGSGYCPAGKKVTLKATANKGFRFVAWCDDDGDLVAKTPSLVVDRTAKPAASSNTSTTLTGIDETTSFFAVFEGDPRVSATPVAFTKSGTPVASEGGKVTGAGRYEPGKKVTLKATANKNFVFGGWFATDGSEPISQAASFSFEMGEEDIDLYARFVTTDEDRGSIAATFNGAAMPSPQDGSPAMTTNVWAGVYLEWPLTSEALSQTTVKVAGLPSGLKFTAKDIMKKGSKTEVEVPANTIYGAPTAASKMDKGGNPTPSNVKVTVTTAGKSSVTYAIALTVDPLPEWAVGNFDGAVGALPNGTVALTVAASGKISGKILEGGRTWSLSASSFSRAERVEDEVVFHATVIAKAGKEVATNEIAVAAVDGIGVLSGTFELSNSQTLELSSYQNLWKRVDTKASQPVFNKNIVVEYYPLGVSGDKNNTVKFTFKKDGAVSFSGKINGVSVSGSAQIVWDGKGWKMTVYAPPKKGFDGWCETFDVTLTKDAQNIVTAVELGGEEPEMVQLWEGGPYWATRNIGAEKPEDYGYYFWWGDTLGYKWENEQFVASDGSVSGFSFEESNAPTYNKDLATLQSEGWITSDGVLAPEHDAAQVQWGGGWRMPTYQELYDLCYNKCDWTWTTQNGVNGYVVRGRGDYASNSIFLPCAGGGDGTSLYGSGSYGDYWSSVPRSDDDNARDLGFGSGDHYTSSYYRGDGFSVRPVQGFAQ